MRRSVCFALCLHFVGSRSPIYAYACTNVYALTHMGIPPYQPFFKHLTAGLRLPGFGRQSFLLVTELNPLCLLHHDHTSSPILIALFQSQFPAEPPPAFALRATAGMPAGLAMKKSAIRNSDI